jgi:hypothetical protein
MLRYGPIQIIQTRIWMAFYPIPMDLDGVLINAKDNQYAVNQIIHILDILMLS